MHRRRIGSRPARPIAQAVGLGVAADYLSELGMEQVAAHEQKITGYALSGLATVPA